MLSSSNCSRPLSSSSQWRICLRKACSELLAFTMMLPSSACCSWSGRKVLYHGLRILQADGPLCRSASSEFPRAAQTDEQRTPSRSRGSRRLLSPAVKQRGTAGRTGQFRLRADGDKFRRRDQRAGQSLLRPLCAGNLS